MIGFTLNLMNTGLQEFHAGAQPWDIQRAVIPAWPFNLNNQQPARARFASWPRDKSIYPASTSSEYTVLNAIGSTELQDGKYLYSPATGQDRGALDSGHRQRQPRRRRKPG